MCGIVDLGDCLLHPCISCGTCHDDLLALDQDKLHPITGQIVKKGGKMFQNNDFHELKGSQFDREMKQKFVDFFCRMNETREPKQGTFLRTISIQNSL